MLPTMTSARLVLLSAVLLSAPALAQVNVTIELPTLQWATPPPLVVVSPGIQVVEDHEQEVYVVDDWYWVRKGKRWYRSRDYRGQWVVAEASWVPGTLVQLPVGRYVRYKPGKPHNPEHHSKGKKHGHGHGQHGHGKHGKGRH
jgi:hypothetical protein